MSALAERECLMRERKGWKARKARKEAKTEVLWGGGGCSIPGLLFLRMLCPEHSCSPALGTERTALQEWSGEEGRRSH